jgi:galactokinase
MHAYGYAPGRVNLIGEHTDYNGGFVLPFAIERGIFVAARTRTDNQVRLWSSEQENEPASFDLSMPLQAGVPAWSNYVRGVIAGLQEERVHLSGFEAVIHASLPAGGGLSSSAALEVATATLGEFLGGVTIDPLKKALLCQKAEHVFAGTPCGVMDQFAVVFGKRGHLLLIDCRSLDRELVAMREGEVSLLIINTKVKHSLSHGGYKTRRDD